MIPKKRILVAGPDVDRLGILRFTLKTWGYAVEIAATKAETLAALARARRELLMVDWKLAGAAELVRWARKNEEQMRTLAIVDAETVPANCQAEGVLLKWAGETRLRELVAILAEKCRGPKSTTKPVLRMCVVMDRFGQGAAEKASAA